MGLLEELFEFILLGRQTTPLDDGHCSQLEEIYHKYNDDYEPTVNRMLNGMGITTPPPTETNYNRFERVVDYVSGKFCALKRTARKILTS